MNKKPKKKIKENILGRIVAIQGPVVDVKFERQEDVPDIFDLITTLTVAGESVSMEVAEHLPGNLARCISLNSTLNIQRDSIAFVPGGGIIIPVGDEVYSRLMNVVGEPIDEKGPINSTEMRPIRTPLLGTKISREEDAVAEIELLELILGFSASQKNPHL